jgi:hypothetical protein
MLPASDESTAVADDPKPSVSDDNLIDKPAEKGVADILAESFRLYRTHARPILLICALLFVPASLVKSCVMSAILTPTLAARSAAEMRQLGGAVEDSGRALADAYARHADADTIARLQRENQTRLAELARASAGPGRFTLWLLGVLATLVSALVVAIAFLLIGGALTIAVADRLGGGQAGWIESWMLLLGRLGKLLAAIVPAAGLIAIGLVLWVIPGLAIAFFFALVAQVCVIEGLGGAAALRRSAGLVGADWLRVALLLGVFGALVWAARRVADLVIPDAAIFTTELVGDLLTLVVLPLPLIAGALLYLDIRKRRENFSDEDLRAALSSLRA